MINMVVIFDIHVQKLASYIASNPQTYDTILCGFLINNEYSLSQVLMYQIFELKKNQIDSLR